MNTIKDFVNNGFVTAYTHGGVMHADDIFSTALIICLCNKQKLDYVVIRLPRDITSVEDGIVYDVLNGQFDHHDKKNDQVNGRKLASFGKLFHHFKEEICSLFHLDEEAWNNIDQNLVKSIDHTDNTGEMNPLSYMFNCSLAESKHTDEDFMIMVSYAKKIILSCFNKERIGAMDREIINNLPVITVKGKVFAVKEEPGYISVPMTHPVLSGVIIRMGDDAIQGKWMIKMCNGLSLSKTGLRNEGDVVFTHPNGFMGKTNTLDAAIDCI